MSGALVPQITFFNNGVPAALGSAYVYQTGTTTKVTIYSDGALGTPITNPINLDANGQCKFYVDGTVNLRMDAYSGLAGAGSLIESVDPVFVTGQPGSAVDITGGTIDGTTIGGTTPAAGTFSSLNGGSLAGFRNAITNGAMNVWQAGTSYALTTTPAYGSADMWGGYMQTSAAGIMAQSASAPTGFKYSLKVGRTNGSVLTGQISVGQVIQTINTLPLANKKVTISFYAKAGANFSATANALACYLYTGTGTDEGVVAALSGTFTGQNSGLNGSVILTGAFQRFSLTFTLPSTAAEMALALLYNPTGTAGADDNFYVTGIQIEPGTIATPFELRPGQIEMSMCRYFYRKSFAQGTTPAQNTATNLGAAAVFIPTGASGTFYYTIQFEPMYAAPTATTYNPNAANANWRDETNSADRTVTVGNISDSLIQISGASGVAASANFIHWVADSRL